MSKNLDHVKSLKVTKTIKEFKFEGKLRLVRSKVLFPETILAKIHERNFSVSVK